MSLKGSPKHDAMTAALKLLLTGPERGPFAFNMILLLIFVLWGRILTMGRKILIIILGAVLLWPPGAAVSHMDEPVVDILLLHSYHQGFVWSDNVTTGILEQLNSSLQRYHLHVEYLDEKQTPGRHLWPSFREILQAKFATADPDIIIAVDDAALQFLLSNDTLFTDTPVVFGGLTHFDDRWYRQRPLLTGATEYGAIFETVEMARRLHPGLRKVVVVNDSTTSGLQRHVQGVLELEPLFTTLETEHWIDLSIDELGARMALLGPDSMVLFGSFYRDVEGHVFTGQDLSHLVGETPKVPIFSIHGPLFGGGVIGGLVNRGEPHGRFIARLVQRVIAGEAPATIPIVRGPLTPLFDYRQLEHFRIDEDDLPPGSKVLNRPPSFVAQHPKLIELGLFLIVLLLALHGASVVLLRVRKKSAEELKHNFRLLQTIIDSIPDAVFYKDAEGRYLGGNKQFYEAIGMPRDQVVGKTVYEVAPTELAQIYHRSDMELMDQGGVQAYETQMRFADGKYHDVLFHKAVFPDEAGQPGGMVGAMLDISERKRMEEELRLREESFRLLFQSIPDPIILTDMDGKIIDVNRSYEEQTGISRDEAVGKTSVELGMWNDPTARNQVVEQLRKVGVVKNVELTLQARNQGERKALFSGRVIDFEGQQRLLFVSRDITKLRRAEEALEQSELRLRTVFEASPDAILLSRAGGGGIVDVNHGFTELWGYDREEVLWRGTSDLNLWVDNDARLRLREQLHRDGSVDDFEITIRCKDGSHRICAASCRLVELDGHRTTLAVLRDVTHLKAAEEALRKSEQKFQAVFHQTYQFMGILDAQGRVIEVNDTALNSLGLQLSDVKGQYFWDTLWWSEGEQREMIRLAVDTAARGNLFQVRTNNLKRDGSLLHIDFSMKPVRDVNGKIIYLIPEGRDITGLYMVEQALRQSEASYRALSGQFQSALDGVPDVMMLFDPEGRLVWGNQSAAKLFGLDEQDQGKKSCREIWGEKEQCAGCRKATFVQGRPWEELVETQDGLSWGIKTFPIKNDQGEVVNVMQVATDLTEKIRLREQASRSAHLAALGEVAAGVAHEINNPAGLLLMDLGLLQDVYFDLVPIIEQHREEHGEFECGGLSVARALEQLPSVFDELRDGAERIKRIVKELKEFANPHAEMLHAAVDLNEVINRTLRLTRKKLNRHCKRVEVELDDQLPTIPGNAQRLEQVLINLLLNAAQAVSGYGEEIRVTSSWDQHRKVNIVTIQDDGRGIAAEKLQMITDPFFTTRREEGGTGLGLSVSSRIIDEHHGVLRFASQEGQGTTVTIELPLQAQEG